jgi:hypothetical protein
LFPAFPIVVRHLLGSPFPPGSPIVLYQHFWKLSSTNCSVGTYLRKVSKDRKQLF